MQYSKTVPWRGECGEFVVYQPKKRPGFVAWATAFCYGDGTWGVSFDEVIEEENPEYTPARLEYAEAAGVPVSYGSVEAGSANRRSYRVYMRTADGKTFAETGRCPRGEGSLCAAGFPDGRILGFDVPRHNEAGTGWSDFIRVRESRDGGSTWADVTRLLNGCAPYLWRVRQLKNGEIVVLASLYGTPWGPGRLRSTRNTMLPGESYESKIQTFFMTTKDGRSFTGPHYILPGIGAHEFDFAELPDGRLLFIAGDVQGTPVGRQFVTPGETGWINGNLLGINEGAPPDPKKNPQGGFVPETIVWDEAQECLVGYRRNQCFSLSNDYGENWTPVLPRQPLNLLYQPVLLALGEKGLALFGHIGGDAAFGQTDTRIVSQLIRLESAGLLAKPTELSLERLMAPDKSHYENAFSAKLTTGGIPLPGQELEFRFNRYWNEDGSVNTKSQSAAPYKIRAVTGEDGCAAARAPWFDGIADIHLAYNADVVCPGGESVRSCRGPMMTVLALTPRRENEFPYDAYFAGGVLYLSPGFLKDFPHAAAVLKAATGEDEVPAQLLGPAAVQRLELSGAAQKKAGRWYWIHSVHAPRLLDDVMPMAGGDWYV